MSQETIPSGIYFGFTRAELTAEMARYKAAVKQSGSRLAGASQNGQSYSFGPRGDMTLADWQTQLQMALAYFGDAEDPADNKQVVRFANHY